VSSEKTWDQRIFERIDPGIDETQLVRNLRLTPTERLKRMQRMLELLEAVKRSVRSQPERK
jgi:hypothetical protein